MGGGGGKVSISKEVSALIKQGFIPDSSAYHSSPSRTDMGSPSSSSSMNVQSSPAQSEMMHEEQVRDVKIGKLQERVWGILDKTPFQNPPEWAGIADLKLSVSSKDGYIKVWVDVHRKVLIFNSGFFQEKLGSIESMVHTVEICDCDDVEVYLETIALMYCAGMEEMLKRLMGEGQTIDKVLSLLRVCVAMKFGTGIETCLTYLESVPWHEEEEQKVCSILSELHSSDQIPVKKVLQRLSPETCKEPHGTMLEVMKLVLLAKDDKAQRDMKTLISRLIKENTACLDNNNIDFFREVNDLCGLCVSSLIRCSYRVLNRELHQEDHRVIMGEIAQEADNLQWIVDILIDNRMGDHLVEVWGDQKELASLHARIPPMYRYEISRITTQLFIAMGRRQILGSKTAKSCLLKTWLDALYGDYEWMKRGCRSFDQKLVEEGLSQTILTLPCGEQQPIILNWFQRYLNKSDNCPNLCKALEVWWRRTYNKQHMAQDIG